MPLRGWGCWIPAVRVVGLLLVGGAAAIFDQTGTTTDLVYNTKPNWVSLQRRRWGGVIIIEVKWVNNQQSM